MVSSYRNRSNGVSTIRRFARNAFAFTFIVVAMLESSNAQVDRTRQPAPDPAPRVTFPPYEEFTLANGLKVFFVRDDSPVVTMRLLVRGGSGLDGVTPGLADAVADMMVKGTLRRSAGEFAEAIDFIGGSIAASASSDAISVSARSLRKHLATTLDLFADAVQSPAFNQEELGKYLQEQISALTSQKARAEFLASSAVDRLLFGDTPYGAMASEAAYRKLSPELLKSFYDARFVPTNATLAVVGSFTGDELKGMLDAAFGGWTGRVAALQKPPKFPVRKGRRVILVDRPASVQSSIRVIGKGPLLKDKDRPQTSILNSILGGGTGLGNRLASNLRETHAWTYSPYSYFDANYYAGYFVAGADVRNEVTDSALTEMFREIERMGNEPVTQEELTRNIQSAVGNYLMSVSDPTTTAVRVQSIDFYGLPRNYYETLVAAYESVTPAMLERLAKTYLDPKDLQVVVVGKASEIKAKLERFGKVEVWNQDLADASQGVPDVRPSDAKADQVWGKMLTALGGAGKLRGITGLETTGAMQVTIAGQTVDGLYRKVEKGPSKQYLELDLSGLKQVQVVDGTRAWQGLPGRGLTEMTGEELSEAVEGALFMPEVRFAELNAKLEMIGERETEGTNVYVVALRYQGGTTTTYYIDKKTYLPVVQETSGGSRAVIKSWVTTDKFKFPGSIDFEQSGNRKFRLTGLKYVVNPQIDEKIFSPLQ